MIWVGWREQRTETFIALGILAAIALLLVPTGIQMAHAYDQDGIAACLGAHSTSACGAAVDAFQNRFNRISSLLGWLTLLPGVIGVLLATPFVSQLESGTYRLDWTQSVTRRRWIAGKLGLAVAVAVIVAAALSALVTWWRTPLGHVNGRMGSEAFDSEGVVVIGYTLFALALSLAIGVVWRRAVAGLVVAFAGYFAVRLFVDTWLRQRLTPAASLTWARQALEPSGLKHAWVVTEYPVDRSGHAIPFSSHPCLAGIPKACTARAPFSMHAVYEPASRFWSMQLVELGLFAGLAVALLAFAVWWTDQRV